MVGTSSTIGKLGYNSFYIPSVTFLYLYSSQSLVEPSLLLPEFGVYGFIFTPRRQLLVLALITLVGAIKLHGLARIIYGPDGPEKRPKRKEIGIRYLLAYITGKAPDDIHPSLVRLSTAGVGQEFSKIFLYPIGLTHRPSYFLIAMNNGEFTDLIRLRRWPRIVRQFPLLILYPLSYFAFAYLSLLLYEGISRFPLLILFAGLFLLLFQNRFWSSLPPVVPPGAIEDIFDPEFKVSSRERKQERRIDRPKKRSTSVRYRRD